MLTSGMHVAKLQMSQFLRSPVASETGIYLLSQQCLWLWDRNNLYRLCSFAGHIRDLRISPDSKHLSFVGTEESNGDIYVYRTETGAIKRATYFDSPLLNNVDLSNAGIVTCATNRTGRGFRLYEVSGATKELKYQDAVWITQSKDIKVLQRFGYGYHMWRNYKGGLAARLFAEDGDGLRKLKFDSNNACRPHFTESGKLFFTSDLDGPLNLYEYHLDKQEWTKVTEHKDFAVRDVSVYKNKVYYSCGGDIYEYDSVTNKSTKIEIVGKDYSYEEGQFVANPVGEYVTDLDISDKCDAVVFAGRGRVFTAPLWKKGILTNTENVRYRFVRFLNKKETLRIRNDVNFEIADESGVIYEAQVNVRSIKNLQVIDENRCIIHDIEEQLLLVTFRPDVTITQITNKSTHLAKIVGFDVSPDKKWIAYARTEVPMESASIAGPSSIYLYDIQRDASHKIADSEFGHSPAFAHDQSCLYFLSDKEFSAHYDSVAFNLGFRQNTALCAFSLRADANHPFKHWLNPEVEAKDDKDESKKDDEISSKDQVAHDAEEGPSSEATKALPENKFKDILLDEMLPVKSGLPNGNYLAIIPTTGKLMLLTADVSIPKETKLELISADLSTNTITSIATEVKNISLSHNMEWMAIYSQGKLRIGKAGEQFDETDKTYKAGGNLSIDDLTVRDGVKSEWSNILEDTWALLRDRFWSGEPNNWNNVLSKYQSLLPKIRSREDLNYLLEELIGETQTSHNYIINRGDTEAIQHKPAGQLGAEFKWNGSGYEALKIHDVRDFDGLRLMPLVEHRVKIGDVLVEIDGVKCKESVPIEAQLIEKGGSTVNLRIRRDKNHYNVYPKALTTINMYLVYYRAWVTANRKYVHKQSNGRIGYIHIPNMGVSGFKEFHKAYLLECGRDGLVIDNRYNGGGHVSPLLTQWLLNRQHGAVIRRGQIEPYPENSHSGPMILLANEYAGSDGDLFTYQFKLHKLGKVVGKRTWGGVVGISPASTLIDNGLTSQPEFGILTLNDGIGIENHGVEPDVEIESSADSDEDLQLKYAVGSIMDELPSVTISQQMLNIYHQITGKPN